jgi:deoxyadenosine/deoxycytidine kinase
VVDSGNIRFIAIEGIVRRSNSQLARSLAKLTDARTILDEDSVEPMIDVQAAEPKDFLLKKHLLRLVDRYKAQKQLWQTEMFYEYILSDYLFYADRIYANLQLDPSDLGIYETLMDSMEKDVVVPDLIVYLQSNPETIIEKVRGSFASRKSRSRDLIDESYLQTLNDEFNQFFMHFRWCPVLIVNANQLDPENPRHTQDLLQKIQRHDAGIGYYNPPVA